MTPIKKCIALSVALALSHSAGLQVAQAAMVSTEAVANVASSEAALARRAHVLSTLNRSDVTAALTEKGVDMDAARARVSALSDAEVAQLADQIDQAPAGAADILGTLVFIFVLLLVTDILGLTKVYPFTRSIRH